MSVLEGPLVFVDIETNGLSHVKGRVIEVAAIRVEGGEVVRSFNKLIDPGTELPQFITRLTGITSHDLRDAPLFAAVADELYDILDGAVFVAHNVRFDYSFLKQEFKRIGKSFTPRQLCTVRLSRALYPEYASHKLQSLIDRHGFAAEHRHRAYDDAYVLWQFLQHVRAAFPPETLEAAIARQIKRPSLPKHLDPAVIDTLPEVTGVYIFEDEHGKPLYIGKSINIKQRVLSHFMRDHDNVGEFKIAQGVHAITTYETAGELAALLLESRLVKEMQPLHNKLLRRTNKLLLARQVPDEQGYLGVALEEVAVIDPAEAGTILAVYPRRSKAREAFDRIIKENVLCPKLFGLEKGKGACFMRQLHKCRGACVGEEAPGVYNDRLLAAFARQRIEDWPYEGPVLLQDKQTTSQAMVVDQWCVIAEVRQEPYCEPVVSRWPAAFDLDSYKILRSYLTTKVGQLTIRPCPSGLLSDTMSV